jgi:DNA (cytosine-5)-methyltransferase 1
MRAVSLFSNCGAGDVGYASAGFAFDVMAEIDPRRLDVAKRNHAAAIGVPGDLRETWPDVVDLFRGLCKDEELGLLSACPPCQGMSSARGRRGLQDDADAGSEDARNLLVVPIAKVAAALRPRIIVVENVTAFLRRQVRHPGTGEPISAARLLVSLLVSDYVAFPFLVDLCDYGVPQIRKRAFVTFVRRDEDCLQVLLKAQRAPYPKPTYAPDHGGAPVTLAEALRTFGLSPLDAACAEKAADPRIPLHCVPVWSPERYAMVAAIPRNSGASAWQNSTCAACGPVKVSRAAVHCRSCGAILPRPVTKVNGRARLVRGFHNSTYRRMSPDSPARTITTATGRIGGNYTLHPYENRVFSPLECARLQTFPLGFEWGDALVKLGHTNVREMIGEAVPPLFTKRHGRVLISLLRNGSTVRLVSAEDRRCLRAEKALNEFGMSVGTPAPHEE